MLPTVARVLERLIYEQLYNYFAENKLLSNEQWGFRSRRSTALKFFESYISERVQCCSVSGYTIKFWDHSYS